MNSDAKDSKELEYECDNCLSRTTENGPCTVCGAEPFDRPGYRIECNECGATEFGDPGTDIQHDMTMHRMEYCTGAEFEVSTL
jgi:DNA-directed RNA polymerase subunit RPC12/RpoP